MIDYLKFATKEELADIDEYHARFKNCSAKELLILAGDMRDSAYRNMTQEDIAFQESLKDIPLSDIELLIIKNRRL